MPNVPLVTIAFPLYRSSSFVKNVIANIDRLTYPRLEILISDRHLFDDALDQLERRYAADERVQILRQPDGADWVTHYNDLLRQARGDFFCWMPHDDVFADGYIDALAAALSADSTAVIAFGVMDSEDCGRTPIGTRFIPPPVMHGRQWSPVEVVRLHLDWALACLMRGLVRREPVLGAGLLVPRTYQLVFADACWVFAVVLLGPALFVAAAQCSKRFYVSGASAGWQFGVREALSEWRHMSRALWQSAHPRRTVWPAVAVLTYVAAGRVIWRGGRQMFGWSGRRLSDRARAMALRPIRWVIGTSSRRD